MRERQVARFLVAPSGYGKTYLALEYAQIVFEYEHVSWIDASSPCFLRDLDRGSLAADLLRRDELLRLVVFDNVPRLGDERAELLSHAIDEILENGMEAIVTCQPSGDAFSGRQIDRICLHARDLLLSPSERIELKGTPEYDSGTRVDIENEGVEAVNYHTAIPLLAWGPQNAMSLFAEGISHEELPDEVLAEQFMIMTLTQASLSWACQKCGLSESRVDMLSYDYPHLGINADDDSFLSIVLPPDLLSMAFNAHIGRFATCLSCETAEECCMMFADLLTDCGNASRACLLMASLASKTSRRTWLLENETKLSRALCLCSAWRLGESAGTLHADVEGSRIGAAQAWRISLLGDTRSALLAASRIAQRTQAPPDARMSALVLIARFGNEVLRAGALERLAILFNATPRDDVRPHGHAVEVDMPYAIVARCLIERYRIEHTPHDARIGHAKEYALLARMWTELASVSPDADASLLAAALIFDVAPELVDDDQFAHLIEEDASTIGIARLEAFRIFSDLAKGETDAGAQAALFFDENMMDAMRVAERSLAAQQQEYGRLLRARGKKAARAADSLTPEEQTSKPEHMSQLHVSLFGGIEVLIDGKVIDSETLTGPKVRALLAVLVMALGREVSQERLFEALWPRANRRSAQKNLYTSWAALRRALSLPDGTCPFLHHVQGGYRIDGRLVMSDIKYVTEICRSLALEKPDPARFRQLLDDLNRYYRGDLLPSETRIDSIVEARSNFRSQVSDTLVQASFRLLDMGESTMALWFARSALEHEHRQEDPYYALMSAQLACGQREAALETYQLCGRALVRAFHIDPSQRMVTLYRQIVETEQVF